MKVGRGTQGGGGEGLGQSLWSSSRPPHEPLCGHSLLLGSPREPSWPHFGMGSTFPWRCPILLGAAGALFAPALLASRSRDEQKTGRASSLLLNLLLTAVGFGFPAPACTRGLSKAIPKLRPSPRRCSCIPQGTVPGGVVGSARGSPPRGPPGCTQQRFFHPFLVLLHLVDASTWLFLALWLVSLHPKPFCTQPCAQEPFPKGLGCVSPARTFARARVCFPELLELHLSCQNDSFLLESRSLA